MNLVSKHSSAIRLSSFMLVSVLTASPTLAVDMAPFEFRGARLGMTIEEFEALPELGAMRLSEYNQRGRKVRENLLTLCVQTNDKVNAQIGITDCTRAGDDPFTAQKYKYVYTSIGYKFGPDVNNKKRLFSILVITNRDNYAEAVSALRAKWGNGRIESSTATNGFGQPLPKSTEKWRKLNQVIELENLCGDVKTICITYSDDSLLNALSTRRATITGGAASRF